MSGMKVAGAWYRGVIGIALACWGRRIARDIPLGDLAILIYWTLSSRGISCQSQERIQQLASASQAHKKNIISRKHLEHYDGKAMAKIRNFLSSFSNRQRYC